MRKRREGVAAATADPAYYMRSPPAISAVPFHYLLIFKISLSSSTKSVQSKEEVEIFPNSAEVWSSAVTLSLFVTFCFCLCVLRRAALACIIILSVFRPSLCQTSSARWHCRHVGLGLAHEALLHGQQTFCQDGRFVRKTFCQDSLRRFVRKTFCQDRLRRFVRTDLP